MNRSILKSIGAIIIVVLVLAVLQMSGQTATAGPGEPGTNSQGTEAQAPSAPGEPLDDLALFPEASGSYYNVPGSTLIPVNETTTLVYDNFGCVHASAGAGWLLNAPLDLPPQSRIVFMRLYYDDTSTSSIDGWITRYNGLGTEFEDLVNVESQGNLGHGSNYATLDHTMDTYDWRYVLIVRLNDATAALQVCGIRVMYYAPIIYGNFMPSIFRGEP